MAGSGPRRPGWQRSGAPTREDTVIATTSGELPAVPRTATPRPHDKELARVRRLSGRRRVRRRRTILVVTLLALAGVGAFVLSRPDAPLPPAQIPGTTPWAVKHYGNPDAPGFKARNITTIDFLGRTMYVHKRAERHFLRLERLFEARAPEYAAAIAAGELDDWSYENRPVRGETTGKSKHAFGLAIDINALTNVLGTTGDMPMEVVRQWELEGGEWGGDWSRPDPMHFETKLTPAQIHERYRPDGTPRNAYLLELVGD